MNNIKSLAKEIVEGEATATHGISLDEFRELYRVVVRMCEENNNKIGETRILLLTESAIVRFSIAPNIIFQINHDKNLSKKDFDIVISPVIEGNIRPISWGSFVWTEFRHGWWIFLLVSIVFYFFFYKESNFSGISTINQLLVDATSLFISIFVLFTISQNRDLLTNKELVRKGFTHQLMQNDYFITSLAITSLICTFTSSSILAQTNPSIINIPFLNKSFQVGFIAIFLTHVAMLFLLDCFISVTRYYLKVIRTAIEGQMYVELMGNRSQTIIKPERTNARTNKKSD